jgi:hypothetical protein
MTNANYGKLVARLIGAWFILALSLSALHVFSTGPNQPPLAFGLAALLPLVLFAIWYGRSEAFRQFTLSLNPRTLTLIQSWRIVGYTFLILYTYGILPGIFALPAGWGDVFIGATAPLVALKLATSAHRKSYLLWQVLGITDLVLAVTLGATSSLLSPEAVPNSAMTVLPLSLIPTFAVPLFLILHIISIAQARRWHEHAPAGERLAAA